MINPETTIPDISPYCKRLAKKLASLELKTVRDLLFYYPSRYEDLSAIKKINELEIGDIATIKAKVEQIQNYRSPQKHKKITEAIISDGTGKLKVVWFNQWYLTNTIKQGDEFYFIAKLSNGYTRELISPDYERVSDNPVHTGRIIPIYPLTEGLSQKQIRTVIKIALEEINQLIDYLPNEIISANNLLGLKEAVLNIHFPASLEIKQKAVWRLSFDELFFNQLKNLWLKKDLALKNAPAINFFETETKKFVSSLPFALTDAQKRSSWEILQDIKNPHPMNRLLNGDVGSGKTLVAALAIYNTALSGLQSTLLAPTEILSEQHYNTFCKLFKDLDIKIGLVTRGKKTTNYKLQTTNSESIIHNSDVIIGTHALLQENIIFKQLGLAVIDEQHRFGVEQRAKLSTPLRSDKSELRGASTTNHNMCPHLLSMTATPIPRTLALIQYGDLNLSIINEMPQGRLYIKTHVVGWHKRLAAYEFIKKQINEGRQAFVICPLIDPSDKLGVKSVSEEYEKLKKEVFPDFEIAMLHGKLKSTEKTEIMERFSARGGSASGGKNNRIDILVSTSVIEVGVDVPNATIMMIEGAERFGLSQLHQFRGRVGRSIHQSYCLLFPTDGATERLKAMETISDGFKLAEMDLKLRGPGKIYGTEQSGKIDFKLADINNLALIKLAQDSASSLLDEDAKLKKYSYLREYLEKRLERVHLE